jgi:agmatine deiminase
MITDRETNFVYFSSLIRKDARYSSFWKRLERVLSEKKIRYSFIENTRDIWCRDYMPVQTGVNKFIQFDYFPDYCLSPKYIAKLTIQSDVRLNHPMDAKHVELVIDGGNIVKSASHIILTEKVLKDNPKFSKESILAILKKELQIEHIHLIPQVPYDITGHADGMVRFMNDSDLLVADYSGGSKSWKARMDKALEKTGLNIIPFPAETTNEKNEDGDYTAKGVYINFMQIGNYILLPQFGLNMDEIALDYTKQLYPHDEVIPIDSNEIALDGGVLNCISWNVQTITNINKLKMTQEELEELQRFDALIKEQSKEELKGAERMLKSPVSWEQARDQTHRIQKEVREIRKLRLRELLKLNDLKTEDTLVQRFDEIAKLLFSEYHIEKGEDRYDFLEIEFYYYTKQHKDIITYPRNVEAGEWFFHTSGVDITFESKCNDVEIKPGVRTPENDYFGGILIRSLLKNNAEAITGPQKCTWVLFDSFDALSEPHKEKWPLIVGNRKKKCSITKTQRWIPYKEETLENR